MWRRFASALGLAVLVGLGVVSPSSAATVSPTAPPTAPATYPATGGAASSWECWPVSVTAAPTDGQTDPPAVTVADQCTVTGWAVDPARPAPVTVTQAGDVAVTVPDTVSINPDDPTVVGARTLASAAIMAGCFGVMLATAWFVTQFAAPPTFGVSVVPRRRR